MSTLSRYYLHTRLTSSGNLKRQEIVEAKTFLMQQFPGLEMSTDVPDALIQKTLLQLMKDSSHELRSFNESARLAEVCLRCYISNAVERACLDLAQKFGLYKQFSRSEILSYVLDDINPLQPLSDSTTYIPLSLKILRTFDPHQSRLGHWTKRLVAQHPELNRLLNERGIYIASDWAILNQASQAQVNRLLSAVLTTQELQRAGALLKCFHCIYRADRLQQNSSTAGKRCPDPNEDQLQRMVESLQTAGISITSFQLLRELRILATQLRRAKQPLSASLDQINCPLEIEQQLPSTEDIFLSKYHQATEECLFEAIQQVLHQRLTQLQTRKPEQAAAFLQALFLFFIDGKSMSEIAPLVGLRQQFQVTRLLKLKQIRSMISQQYVSLMEVRLQKILAEDLLADDLAQLKLKPMLMEVSEQLMAEDAMECYGARRISRSLFSLCIRRFLKFSNGLRVKR